MIRKGILEVFNGIGLGVVFILLASLAGSKAPTRANVDSDVADSVESNEQTGNFVKSEKVEPNEQVNPVDSDSLRYESSDSTFNQSECSDFFLEVEPECQVDAENEQTVQVDSDSFRYESLSSESDELKLKDIRESKKDLERKYVISKKIYNLGVKLRYDQERVCNDEYTMHESYIYLVCHRINIHKNNLKNTCKKTISEKDLENIFGIFEKMIKIKNDKQFEISNLAWNFLEMVITDEITISGDLIHLMNVLDNKFFNAKDSFKIKVLHRAKECKFISHENYNDLKKKFDVNLTTVLE
ncbi:MAG: hypothetical protein RsTaC01_0272 [Candidatus Paraimprobicoccus trichonymphae]|uniref:Uncharacterized protein n=1 Tax=Candidatus Paraimprobicoccus trichonymphae TaxID=3033793 RepID=A0AA48IBN0_9FIRM|nr:MAG: hypothetical protein RsTaC01_0272 [Candidatus Paraimprobicoccus trichonymphae]